MPQALVTLPGLSLPVHTGLIPRDLVEGVTSVQEQQRQLVDQGPVSKLEWRTRGGFSPGQWALLSSTLRRAEATKWEHDLGVNLLPPSLPPAAPEGWGACSGG